MKVKTRFAPSPTGPLHIGGIRTALYNYLFAKKHNGEFILRIEDTDQKRLDVTSEQYILDTFEWLNINFDKGPHIESNVEYRQSERQYSKYIEFLLDEKRAYIAFDTEEELDEIRKEYESRKEVFIYNHSTRMNMINSLTLSEEEVKERIKNNEPYVVRYDMPVDQEIIITDLIRGKVKFNTSLLDDKVLMKKDKTPTYHLANVVDDKLMEITHVIRGEEWLPSTPLHVLLYRDFKWKVPEFAHLNLILNPDGKGKLSKRNAVKKGFSVFPLTTNIKVDGKPYEMEGYKEKGYEKEAIINYLLTLGWSNEEEIFELDSVIERFDLNKLSKKGSRFDINKLDWYNLQYIRHLNFDLPLHCYGEERTDRIINIILDRIKFRKEVDSIKNIFYDFDYLKSYTSIDKVSEESLEFMNVLIDSQIVLENTPEKIKKQFYEICIEKNIKFVKTLYGIRKALTKSSKGPDLFEIIYIIGIDETKKRFKTLINYINYTKL